MTQTVTNFENAELALAAYATLVPGFSNEQPQRDALSPAAIHQSSRNSTTPPRVSAPSYSKTRAALTDAQRAAGQANYSDRWLADRMAMRNTLVQADAIDEGFVNDATVTNVTVYEDKASNTVVLRQPGGPGAYPTRNVIFGVSDNNAPQTLTGANTNDSLYGGSRADILIGNGGDDYLEGGKGIDDLQGGDGQDVLVGGADADALRGGAGNDIVNGQGGNDHLEGEAGADTLDGGGGSDELLGGDGGDTYVFSGSFGQDTILDSDGPRALQVEGFTGGLPSGRKRADGIYVSDDDRVVYALVAVSATRKELKIGLAGSKNEITIQNWSSARSLDITLDENLVVPTTTATYDGEFAKAVSGDAYVLTATGYASAGPAPNAPDVLNGTSGPDTLTGDDSDWTVAGELSSGKAIRAELANSCRPWSAP